MYPMAHANTQTERQTDGHRDFKTESAKWADSVKISLTQQKLSEGPKDKKYAVFKAAQGMNMSLQ